MSEKRRFQRLPITLTLEVSSLFNQNEEVNIGNAEFNVFDISKVGIGFTTTTKIPLEYYFNATIHFDDSGDCLKYVVKVIRTEVLENGEYLYGCEFVGFASIYDYLFDQYETTLQTEE